jgi:hypothetical protein
MLLPPIIFPNSGGGLGIEVYAYAALNSHAKIYIHKRISRPFIRGRLIIVIGCPQSFI